MSDSLSPHPFYGAASYGHGHLFAPVRHDPVSRDAWQVEKSPPPRALLARGHAGPFPRAANLGRPRPLAPRRDHGGALSARYVITGVCNAWLLRLPLLFCCLPSGVVLERCSRSTRRQRRERCI